MPNFLDTTGLNYLWTKLKEKLDTKADKSDMQKIYYGTEEPTEDYDIWINPDASSSTQIDDVPTQGSSNIITSGGVYDAINNIPMPDVASYIETHNTATDTHVDIREMAYSHIEKTDNPHGVTAEQVGARSVDWMPTAEDVGARPNTWTPTYSDVGAAASSHTHAAGDITSGTLGVGRGGTGVTANPSMLTNLGSTSAASVFAASPRPGVTGTLSVANGGTGATTLTPAVGTKGARQIYAGTSAMTAGSTSLTTGVVYLQYE